MKLIKGNIIFTKDKDRFEIIEDGFIVEDNGIIVEVGQNLDQKYDLALIDYTGHLILPGFTDLHFHAPQYGNIGLGLNEQLLEWLDQYTFKEEIKFKDKEYAETIFKSALKAIINAGTTRIVFFSTIHDEATELLIELCKDQGIGAFVGKVNMDRNAPEALLEEPTESLESTKRFMTNYTEGPVKSIITPRFVPSCSDDLLLQLGKLAKNGLPVQTHISENKGEIDWVKELHPNRKHYLDVYDHYGLLNEKTILAHCVYSGEDEIRTMKDRGLYIAHCPMANFNLASGVMPVRRFLDQGINIGLGTDVGAGHSVSIKETMVQAIQMSKMNQVENGEKCLTFSEVFYMATKGGGSYFGKVGSFEKGYAADLLVIKPDLLSLYKQNSIYEQLQRFIYSGNLDQIVESYCNGQILKSN